MTGNNLESILEANPNYKLMSKGKLKKKLEYEGVTKQEIDAYFNPRELHQVYAHPKKYSPLKITAPPYSFQMDIAFLPAYKKQNKGIEAFLILVDILSRKAFLYPLKSRKMSVIMDAYEEFLKDVGEQVNSVAGDDEFNNVEFKEFNNEMYINVYTDVAKEDHIVKGKGDKLGIVDRCIRTIKQYIQKYMLEHDDFKWIKYIGKLIDLYNDMPHQGIKDMTPNEVFDDYDYMKGLYKGQKKHNQTVNESFDLKPGDSVRALLGKGTFEKEKQKFSSDIYTIKQQAGFRFILIDESGKVVKRKYRANELLKIDKVVNRLSKKKTEVEREHKHIRKTSKAIDKGYLETIDQIAKVHEQKSKRITKRPTKLDL
jgi:hypothetical protein